jgi:hypothetical protein
MCGVRESVVWRDSRLTWADGTPAPLCEPCAVVYRRRGEPYQADDVRRVAVEALTGHPVPLGNSAPAEFRCYYEHRDCDGNGYAQRWAYSDGVRRYAEEVWTGSPEYAPQSAESSSSSAMRPSS